MGHGHIQSLAYVVQAIWDLWNLRSCLILSLFLQVFLMLVASMRKRCKSNLLHLCIWSAYFLADWIAAYALGQTVQRIGDSITSFSHIYLYDPDKRGDLYLFWAQFLLLHLAGPDSITSFSPGDNGFWLKQLFGLLCQVVATLYCFFLLAFATENQLWIPTILLFFVGLIKCYERVKALLHASSDSFGEFLLPEPNPGPDFDELMAEHSIREPVIPARSISMTGLSQPTARSRPIARSRFMTGLPQPTVRSISMDVTAQLTAQSLFMLRQLWPTVGFKKEIRTKVNDLKLLRDADSFFEDFKILFTGSFLSFENREKSRNYFMRCHYSEAFRLIEYELSFLHDLMHTKVVVLHNALGYIRKFTCFSCVLAASIFFFKVEKEGLYEKFDVYLTHALLIGTIFLDIMSLTKIIFSEWSVIKIPRIRHLIPAFILKRKQWSKSVFQDNMFDFCLHKRPPHLLYFLADYIFGSTGFVDKMRLWFSSSEKVTEDLEEFIFNELKIKSDHKNSLRDAMEACKDRGLYALLRDSSGSTNNTSPSSYRKLERSIKEFHYLESLLLWHLATELCCNLDQNSMSSNCNKNQIKYCKLLSNYMFYLLVTQPTMLSQEMENWSIVFQDTRAELRRFFTKHSIPHRMEACQKLISTITLFRPAVVKRSTSKSVLLDACILAKELRDMEGRQWEVMSRVWMELMSFGAMSCSPALHAQQPSRGGELLTFTWLLMYHLGLGTQFSEPLEPLAPTKTS